MRTWECSPSPRMAGKTGGGNLDMCPQEDEGKSPTVSCPPGLPGPAIPFRGGGKWQKPKW